MKLLTIGKSPVETLVRDRTDFACVVVHHANNSVSKLERLENLKSKLFIKWEIFSIEVN